MSENGERYGYGYIIETDCRHCGAWVPVRDRCTNCGAELFPHARTTNTVEQPGSADDEVIDERPAAVQP